jgi:hypothetical protein
MEEWGQASHIFAPDGIAFFPQLRQRSIHIDGVPEDDYVEHKPKRP